MRWQWPLSFSKTQRDFGAAERDQLVALLNAYAVYANWGIDSIFLGGSRSVKSPKEPRPDSDVDVYVFVQELGGHGYVYDQDRTLAQMLNGMMGFNFDVHVAWSTFEPIVSSSMEVLYRG